MAPKFSAINVTSDAPNERPKSNLTFNGDGATDMKSAVGMSTPWSSAQKKSVRIVEDADRENIEN